MALSRGDFCPHRKRNRMQTRRDDREDQGGRLGTQPPTPDVDSSVRSRERREGRSCGCPPHPHPTQLVACQPACHPGNYHIYVTFPF